MPQLLDERRLIIQFSDLYHRSPIIRPDKPLKRYPGAHQSDILSHVARSLGHLKAGEKLEEDIPERMLMGIMWEEFYFSLVRDAEWQPGEVVDGETIAALSDGIAGNCDGIGILPEGDERYVELGVAGQPFIEETKCTEKKVKTGADFLEDWMWMHQGRSYCYLYGPRIVRWIIWYYRGDYRGSGPVCMQYLVRFTEKEIRSTWAMMRNYRVEAMEALAAERETK